MEIQTDSTIRKISAAIPGLQREYQRGVNRDLSQRQWQGVLERQILNLLDRYLTICRDALSVNAALPDEQIDTCVQAALCNALGAMKNDLIAYALSFNRTSCALSNFGEEHAPGADYLSRILAQAEIRWAQWCAGCGLA